MKKHIPNSLTLANLLCGCVGIIQIFDGEPREASYWMLLAAVFDFFDGFVARLLKVTSPIGRDLDSLADVVTFGVLPSFILLHLAEQSGPSVWNYGVLIVAAFSALRLAKFNNDPRQSDRFIGLPTPANGLLIASFPFIAAGSGPLSDWIGTQWFILAAAVVSAALLVAELPLLALKFKGFQWRGNQYRYALIASSLVLLPVLKWSAVPLIAILYLALSFFANLKTGVSGEP
ncbi:CDP-alcohol phosphatidyltransferase family protein [Ravibacter arvi]|uniref:CDP-diacylglycerol--serine O-phosphatidyltransferase n=1 Tax=Ravibacter arvi TaxID=2051041 RepID=A0ABP8LLW4_9BACT